MLLTRQTPLNQGAKIEKVNLSQWADIDTATAQPGDLHIYVRELSVSEKDAYEESLWKGRGQKRQLKLNGARAKLIQVAACDETGKRVFTYADTDYLQSCPAAMMSKIYDAAMRLNGFSQEDEEELVKN